MFRERPDKVTSIDIINVLERSQNIYCTVAGSDYEKLGIHDCSRLEIERCDVLAVGKIFLYSIDDSVRVTLFTKNSKNHLQNISMTIEEYESLKSEKRIILFGQVKRIFNRTRKSKLRP